jgi:hypothetical protein
MQHSERKAFCRGGSTGGFDHFPAVLFSPLIAEILCWGWFSRAGARSNPAAFSSPLSSCVYLKSRLASDDENGRVTAMRVYIR